MALLAGLLAAWADARAEGFGLGLYLDPAYTQGTQETTDQLGHVTRSETRSFVQSYRLTLDRQLGSALSFSAGASFQERSLQDRTDAHVTHLDQTERGAFGRILLALPVLNGGLTYDTGDARGTGTLRLLRDDVAAFVSWRPVELPELTARLSQSHHYDANRLTQDLTTTSALLSVRYQDAPLEAKYALLWGRPADAISGTETSSIDQVLQGTYGGALLEDRTTVYASLTLRNQVMRTLTVGTGDLSVQQHPLGGLSLIEAFPVQPADGTLVPNPALVDGNLEAGAALDLGFGPSLAGDRSLRDLGVQFADVLTGVNRFHVWVDKRLPPELAIAYTWTAWRSDDNRTWLPVAITGPVTFAPFQNLFEIPVQETQARYLKVVTQPLQAGLTTDQAFSSVQVTELQVFLVTRAGAAPRDQATSGASLNLSASTLVWRAAGLSWDVTGVVERRLSPTATTWSLMNGLVGNQSLARALLLSERLSRLDGDYGAGRSGHTEWGASLMWRPMPTFTGSLAYGGQYIDARPELEVATGQYVTKVGGWQNALSSFARADLYEGVSGQVNLSTGLQSEPDGKNTWGSTFNATAALVPNRFLTLTLGWLSSVTSVWVGAEPATRTPSARADASLTARPTSAISLAGTLSRTLTGAAPTTSGSAQASYAPLRGDLQLTASYASTFDTASESTLRSFVPGLRWNVRPGVQLTVNYSMLDAATPASRTRSRFFGAALSINP
jgi:hypothetical protein